MSDGLSRQQRRAADRDARKAAKRDPGAEPTMNPMQGIVAALEQLDEMSDAQDTMRTAVHMAEEKITELTGIVAQLSERVEKLEAGRKASDGTAPAQGG